MPCGSPTAFISGACGLASHLRVARGCPHPTSPACAGPGRQDAAGVPGGEAQPAAGRERLLPAVLLVSPAWAETPRSRGYSLAPTPVLSPGLGPGIAPDLLCVCVYYLICLTLTVPLQILKSDTACAETNRHILTFRRVINR